MAAGWLDALEAPEAVKRDRAGLSSGAGRQRGGVMSWVSRQRGGVMSWAGGLAGCEVR